MRAQTKRKASPPTTKPRSNLQAAREVEETSNLRFKDEWALYTQHRQHLTQALMAATEGIATPRIALLGAGNCNDVDLAALVERGASIHLIDLDPTALARAVARLTPSQQAAISCYAPVDLSGLFAWIDDRGDRELSLTEVDDWAARSGRDLAAKLPGNFDVAASCCVLTQMSWSLVRTFGGESLLLAHLREAMMKLHLHTLAALLRPEGRMLLACDLVSSDQYPLEALPPTADLAMVMSEVVSTDVFFRGANPLLINRLLWRDPLLSRALTDTQRLHPWLWTGPLDRTYLVYALTARRTHVGL